MASLIAAYADRTNRVLLAFDVDLDVDVLDVGAGVLTAADGGDVPALLIYETVPGDPSQVRAVLDGRLRRVSYSLAYSGLYAAGGSHVTGTATFLGILPSGPRLSGYDRRLKIDLGLGATAGGDLALLTGDELIREQALRVLTWEQGELLAEPGFGRPFRAAGLLNTRRLAEYKRTGEASLRGIPGVLQAELSLSVGQDVFRATARLKTSQSEIEVSAERLQGR